MSVREILLARYLVVGLLAGGHTRKESFHRIVPFP